MKTELAKACISGDLNKVKHILSNYPDLIKDKYPFQAAIARGNLSVVKYLIEQGADVLQVEDWCIRFATDDRRIDVLLHLREVAGKKWKCSTCLIRSTCLELCEGFNNGLE